MIYQADKPLPGWVDKLWLACLTLLLPFAWMLKLGIDANWDLRNYHLYNPHAWFTGRDAIDIAPAQLQSWHNPLLDVPLYLLTVSGLDARWSAAWLTLPAVVSLVLLLQLHRLLSPVPPTRASQLVLAVLAITGAAFGSTMGISMNDGFVAAAMLASLWLLVRDSDDFAGRHRWLVAGLVAGSMAGLKLTAIVYCCGLAAAALVVEGPMIRKLRRLLALALGGALGFALTYGYWGWHLFKTYGNPIFPYYNNFFVSPAVLPQHWTDGRFHARSLWDALSSPFQLLYRTSHFSEMPIRDPRLLLALLGLLALCAVYRARRHALYRQLALLLAFAATSWLLWVSQYGIYRYAIVLELLGCLALVLLVQQLPRARNIALVLALLLVSADTKRPDWGRIRSTVPMAGIVAQNLPGNSLVVIANGEPVAYLALAIPDGVPLVSVSNNFMAPGQCAGLAMRAQAMIASHAGPIWLLSVPGPAKDSAQALVTQSFGLRPAGSCSTVINSLAEARLCPQVKTTANAPASACRK